MSLLDVNKTVNDLSERVLESDLNYIYNTLCHYQLVEPSNGNTCYSYIYRIDKLLTVADDYVCDISQSNQIVYLSDISLENVNTYPCEAPTHPSPPYLDVHKKCITFYLKEYVKAGVFSYLNLYINDDDEIILEPIDRTSPILLKDINKKLPCKFHCPDWYRGYILAVDCDKMVVKEMCHDFMIMYEDSIIQSLP